MLQQYNIVMQDRTFNAIEWVFIISLRVDKDCIVNARTRTIHTHTHTRARARARARIRIFLHH